MEYQVKVEYTGAQGDGQKWISFVVSASKVNCGQSSIASLVHDIKSRCLSLDYVKMSKQCVFVTWMTRIVGSILILTILED